MSFIQLCLLIFSAVVFAATSHAEPPRITPIELEAALSQGDAISIQKLLQELAAPLTPYELDRVPRNRRTWFKSSPELPYQSINTAIENYTKRHPFADLYFQSLIQQAFNSKNLADIAAVSFLLSNPTWINTLKPSTLRNDIKFTLLFLTFHPCPIVRSNAYTGLAAFVSEDENVATRLKHSLEMPIFNRGLFGETELNHYKTAVEKHKMNLGFSNPKWREQAHTELLRFQTLFSDRYKGTKEDLDESDYRFELQALSAAAQALIWTAGQRKFGIPPRFELGENFVTRYLVSGIADGEDEQYPNPLIFTDPSQHWMVLSEPAYKIKESLLKAAGHSVELRFGDLQSQISWLKYGLYQEYPPLTYIEALRVLMYREEQSFIDFIDEEPLEAKGSMAHDNNDLWVMHPKKIFALRALALLGESPFYIEQEVTKILPTYMPDFNFSRDTDLQWHYHAESLALLIEILKMVNPNEQAFRHKINLWVEKIKSAELKNHVLTKVVPQQIFHAEGTTECEVILFPFNRLKARQNPQ